MVVVSGGSPKPAGALFHFAVIDEVMAGYNGDPNVQYVEIRQTSSGQNLVAHSIIGYFNAAGAYQGDILEMPADVPSGSNLRWIVGTAAIRRCLGNLHRSSPLRPSPSPRRG